MCRAWGRPDMTSSLTHEPGWWGLGPAESLLSARSRQVREALVEDIGPWDPTALLTPSRRVRAELWLREPAVLCGQHWFEDCFRALDPDCTFSWSWLEGEEPHQGAAVCTLEAESRALLSAERPALNFLQTLSAVATRTRRLVKALEGASPLPQGVQLLDTRKTLPGLRQAEKYAVRVGGGANQRMALWDGILIKENHILAAGGIPQVLQAARAIALRAPELGLPIPSLQIEVETLDELRQALESGARSVLLDNFTREALAEAVRVTRKTTAGSHWVLLEASGGLAANPDSPADLESLRAVAATGVDRISIGSLTKSVQAVDFSLRVAPG